MAVFTGYTEQNSSQMPGVCLGGDGWICRQSYWLIVSTNSQLWGAQVMKDLNNSHFLLSPRWPLWRGLNVFKNTLEV